MFSYSLVSLAISFLATLGIIFALSPLARRVGLTDKPDSRKTHRGQIPLVGGIAIFLPLLSAAAFTADPDLTVFMLGAGMLVFVGALDDRFDLDFKLRIGVELVAGALMIFAAGLWIGNLGNLFGYGDIHLPFWLGVPFTLIAGLGIINALNMIDGYDGIAGGVCLAALATLEFLTSTSTALGTFGPLLIGGLLAFLVCNLKAFDGAPKIFLGDAGSKLLGFALVWFLIEAAQDGGRTQGGLEPVTALYLVGLPLIDMATTTVRRLGKGQSPFRADRTHIHHILQRAGFRKDQIILSILTLAFAINLLGISLQILDWPDYLQFGLFMGLYLLYAFNIQHAWKVAKWLRSEPSSDTEVQTSVPSEPEHN